METETRAAASKSGTLKSCSVLTGIGWFILAGSVLYGLFGIYKLWNHTHAQPDTPLAWDLMVLGDMVGMILMGVVALMVARFINYLFSASDELPPLIRHGDKLLFLYAAVSCLEGVALVVNYMTTDPNSGMSAVVVMFPPMVPVLLLVGIGVVLRKVVFAINEVKGLV